MKFNLQVKGINEVKRSLNKFNKETVRELQREIDKTSFDIQRRARRVAPSDRGILRARIQRSSGMLAAIVWSGAKYSLDVEKGQEPGKWPNKSDLEGWVKRNIKPPKKRLKGITYLIGRKIYKRGTDAQPFFEPTVKYYKQRFFNNVTRIMKKL